MHDRGTVVMGRRPGRCKLCALGFALASALLAAPAVAMPSPGTASSLSPGIAREGFSFSLDASAGVVEGSASELVFDYPYSGKTKISELSWDLKDVALAGVQASVGYGSRISLNAGFWKAVNEGNGGMVDRDWVYPNDAYFFLEPGDDNWTHESRHPDTSLDDAELIDVSLSIVAVQSGPFALRGILGYSSDTWAWSSRGGTYTYSENSYRDTTGSFTDGEQVISYEQQYAIPYLGVGASWATPSFVLDGYLLASSIVTASDTDYHILRDTYFYGDFSGGAYFGAGVQAAWTFSSHWSATFGVTYQSISEMTGDVSMSSPEGTEEYPGGGGLALSATVVSLGAGYRF